MEKLKKIILVIIFVVLAIVAFVFLMQDRNKESNSNEPVVQPEEQNTSPETKLSIIDDKDFSVISSDQTYVVGMTQFKIYPSQESANAFIPGWFEVYGKGIKIASNKDVADGQVVGLTVVQFGDTKYVVVRDYSGGAHCCDNDYLFRINKNNDTKLIKMFEMGNGAINKEAFITKNNKLYMMVGDDSFAYFHTSFAGSYFFKQYYQLDGDTLTLANNDFKDDFMGMAQDCANDIDKDVAASKDTAYFENWFNDVLCYMTNKTLIGDEAVASKGFDGYFDQFAKGGVVKDSFNVTLAKQSLRKELLDTLHKDRFK